MKKLSLMLATLVVISSVAIAKEIVVAPTVAIEPIVIVAEEKIEVTAETPISRDFKFVNFNLMHGNGMTALGPKANDTYLEIEIGGRKGAFDFYGYIDFSDVVHNEEFSDFNVKSEKAGNTNFFAELMPRLSMNEMFNADLSLGPVKEVYLAGYLKAGESDLWINGLGLGTDIEVPWLGTMGLNAYALYVAEDFDSEREEKWDGYLVKNNWFKPFYFFENGTFLAYQGYMAYQFDAAYKDEHRTSDEFQWFNGFYWHSDNYALGYGLKYTKNMINGKDGAEIPWNGKKVESTGFSHFFAVTYKF
ncbi:MAG: outer membrane protein OmpK [Fusobacteriaceae bacterium]